MKKFKRLGESAAMGCGCSTLLTLSFFVLYLSFGQFKQPGDYRSVLAKYDQRFPKIVREESISNKALTARDGAVFSSLFYGASSLLMGAGYWLSSRKDWEREDELERERALRKNLSPIESTAKDGLGDSIYLPSSKWDSVDFPSSSYTPRTYEEKFRDELDIFDKTGHI